MQSPNSNLIHEKDRKAEIINIQFVQNINAFQPGSNGNLNNRYSWGLLKIILSLLSFIVADHLLFDIDFHINYLSNISLSLIFYLLFNHTIDALFAFFS